MRSFRLLVGLLLTVVGVASGQVSCPVTIDPAVFVGTVPASGYTGQVRVTPVNNDCSYVVGTPTPGWAVLNYVGDYAKGPQVLSYEVKPNLSGQVRIIRIVAGDKYLDIPQQASSCGASITPKEVTVPASGASIPVTVTIGAGCSWTSESRAAWIASPAGGTGPGTVTVNIPANTGYSMRYATVEIATNFFNVIQEAAPLCTYTFTPSSAVHGAAAGTYSFDVATPASCDWTATTTSPSWLTVTSARDNRGPGRVTYQVAANAYMTARQGSILAGTQYFQVGQNGAPCTYTLNPTRATAGYVAGEALVQLETPGGCPWSLSGGSAWLSWGSSASGQGSQVLSYRYSKNEGGAARSAVLTVGGATLEVTQNGDPAACSYEVTPLTREVGAEAGNGTLQVTAAAGCSWSAAPDSDWLTVTSGASGAGSGTVAYAFTANAATATRSGSVNVGGKRFQLTQAGRPCTVSFSPASAMAPAGAGSGTVSLETGTSCGWSVAAEASWLTVAPAAGTGPATLSYQYEENAAAAARSTALVSGTGRFVLTQAERAVGQSCDLTLGQSLVQVGQESGRVKVAVSTGTGCEWRADNPARSWLTVAPESGSGAGELEIVYAANVSERARRTVVTVGKQTVVVQQSAGTGCSLSMTPTAAEYGASGGSNRIEVKTGAGCAWTARPTVPWLTVSSGQTGTGPGVVEYTVPALASGEDRSGGINIGGAVAQVRQRTGPEARLEYVAMKPCRLLDTRTTGGALAAGESRTFRPAEMGCQAPGNAAGYSLNVAVVPSGPLNELSLFASGLPKPETLVLSSTDGRIKSSAAVVGAGERGAIEAYASEPTHLILDLNGYFVPAGDGAGTELAFYPLAPCRLVDTRKETGPFGGPSLAASKSRVFGIGGECGLPADARAYSLNLAVVPKGPLGYLTAWPAGSEQPVVATLNALTGAVTANAAIVPAGTGGAISLFATDTTDVVIDVNGYFAPAGTGGLRFHTVPPCRVAEVELAAGAHEIPMQSRSCGLPASAQAYALTATVEPQTSLGYLTLWPAGAEQPLVATLNAVDGVVTSNGAIVPAGKAGSIQAFVTQAAKLILEVTGYFAP